MMRPMNERQTLMQFSRNLATRADSVYEGARKQNLSPWLVSAASPRVQDREEMVHSYRQRMPSKKARLPRPAEQEVLLRQRPQPTRACSKPSGSQSDPTEVASDAP